MDIQYVRDKITELRIKRGISAYELSYQLGHSKNYIHNIVSGHSQTTVQELLFMIDYFGVTPKDFFDEQQTFSDPVLANQIIEKMQKMPPQDLAALAHLVNKIEDDQKSLSY